MSSLHEGPSNHAVLNYFFSKVAPFIAGLKEYDERIPTAVFGVVALVAGLLVTFLPETSNTPLPDTIQVNKGGAGQGPLFYLTREANFATNLIITVRAEPLFYARIRTLVFINANLNLHLKGQTGYVRKLN